MTAPIPQPKEVWSPSNPSDVVLTPEEVTPYLSNIPLRLDEFDRMYFYNREYCRLSIEANTGNGILGDKGEEGPCVTVCLESTDDYSLCAWKEGCTCDGLEALDLYNRYIAQVPRDKDGKVAATLDNFKEFLRGEGFGSFSDDE